MERTRNTFLAIFGVTFIAALGVLTFLMLRDYQRVRATGDFAEALGQIADDQIATQTAAATITPPPTSTPLPTETPAPDLRATARAHVAATRSAIPAGLAEAQGWPILIRETFDNNDNAWDTAPGDEALSKDDRRIQDGKFIWTIEAYGGFTWVEPLPGSQLTDRFYATLDIEQSEPLLNDQGISFNYIDSQNLYLFSTCDIPGTVGFFRRVEGSWLTLQSCRQVDAINRTGPNTLSVLGNGNYYQLFVNDQYISDLWDNTFSAGGVGVYIEMDADQTNVFSFDNLEVRSPESGR